MNISWLSKQIVEVEEDSTTIPDNNAVDGCDLACSDLAMLLIIRSWPNPMAMDN